MSYKYTESRRRKIEKSCYKGMNWHKFNNGLRRRSALLTSMDKIAWQKKTGYGLRNYAEFAVQRYKRIFGNAMKARAL